MISYNPQAAPAIGFLKAPLNDIEVFVEDTSKSYLWLALIKSCLPKGIKLSSVTPLGGRKAVEQACAADQAASTRRRLYIVDADLDYVIGRGRRRLLHLYRIPAYCLEGLVFNEQRVLGLVADLRPDLMQIAPQSYRQYFNTDWGPLLRGLSMRYAVSLLADGAEPTSSFHVGRLGVSNNGYFVCDHSAVQARCTAIMADASGRKRVPTSKLRRIAKNSKALPLEKVISGKTYLIVLLQRWIRSFAGSDLKLDVLFTMLIAKGGCVDTQLRRRLASC